MKRMVRHSAPDGLPQTLHVRFAETVLDKENRASPAIPQSFEACRQEAFCLKKFLQIRHVLQPR